MASISSRLLLLLVVLLMTSMSIAFVPPTFKTSTRTATMTIVVAATTSTEHQPSAEEGESKKKEIKMDHKNSAKSNDEEWQPEAESAFAHFFTKLATTDEESDEMKEFLAQQHDNNNGADEKWLDLLHGMKSVYAEQLKNAPPQKQQQQPSSDGA